MASIPDVRAYLSLGSNIDRHANLGYALDALLERFGALVLSSVYESAAVGFDGPPFYNLAAGIDTRLGVRRIQAALRAIEDLRGRDRSRPRYSDRTLDIDLLTCGELQGEHGGVLLPRPEILTQSHVLGPLAEIAPALVLPGVTQPLADLWRAGDAPVLTVVPFRWRGRDLSGQAGAKLVR